MLQRKLPSSISYSALVATFILIAGVFFSVGHMLDGKNVQNVYAQAGSPGMCVQVSLEHKGVGKHNNTMKIVVFNEATSKVIFKRTVISDADGKAYLEGNVLNKIDPLTEYSVFVKPKGFSRKKLEKQIGFVGVGCLDMGKASFGDIDEDGDLNLSDLSKAISHYRGSNTNAVLQDLYGEDIGLRHIIWIIKNYVGGVKDECVTVENCSGNEECVNDSDCSIGEKCSVGICIEAEYCGDNVIDAAEVCDGTDLDGEMCVDQGFDSGNLACLTDCSGFDVSGCISACVTNCSGMTCGDDGCGGNCGTCSGNDSCVSGSCVSSLVGIFVTPGTADQHTGADGTEANPYDLQTALSLGSSVAPGTTIWLKGGTYLGRYTSNLSGTAANPLIVRSYSGERVILDGNISYLPDNFLLQDLGPVGNYSTDTIRLTDTSFISKGMTFRIDDEIMKYHSIIDGTTMRVTRGWSGTDADVTHSAGEKIEYDENTSILTQSSGEYVWYQDFEIMNSDTNKRFITVTGSNPFDRRGGGVDIRAPSIKLINLIIYDTGQGIGSWITAPDFEAYGNIIFNNGWESTDRLHGHGIYTQNKTGNKLYKSNIVFNNFGQEIAMYGSSNAFLNNFTWDENILFNGRLLFGGSTPTNNLTVKNNLLYDRFELGYNNKYNSDILFENNYFGVMPGFRLSKNVNVINNTFIKGVAVRLDALPVNNADDYFFDNNTYYKWNESYPYHQFSFYAITNDDGKTYCPSHFWWDSNSEGFGYGNCIDNTWNEELGYDQNSVMNYFVKTGVDTFVTPNEYDSNKAFITIFNWDDLNSTDVDASGILSSGDTYILRNVQDYFNDVVTGTYDGNKITIDMRKASHSVAKPVGYGSTLGDNTFPEFGVFALEKTN